MAWSFQSPETSLFYKISKVMTDSGTTLVILLSAQGFISFLHSGPSNCTRYT